MTAENSSFFERHNRLTVAGIVAVAAIAMLAVELPVGVSPPEHPAPSPDTTTTVAS